MEENLRSEIICLFAREQGKRRHFGLDVSSQETTDASGGADVPRLRFRETHERLAWFIADEINPRVDAALDLGRDVVCGLIELGRRVVFEGGFEDVVIVVEAKKLSKKAHSGYLQGGIFAKALRRQCHFQHFVAKQTDTCCLEEAGIVHDVFAVELFNILCQSSEE